MTPVADALAAASLLLNRLHVPHALMGGLAVSVRTEPRFTRDADLAVAVPDDAKAEEIVRSFVQAGYRLLAGIEQDAVGRLATVRPVSPASTASGVVVDLLFASSGIEPEIAAAADPIEIFPGVTVGVARIGDLIALKLLARDDRRRPQDRVDLAHLIGTANREDLLHAATAVNLIESRGFARGRQLAVALRETIEEFATPT